ncbi:hypothetical protein [Solidesulfovibrio sp.]|uniref:hypothetical protein n=1 Tax=Solidesulfovibrio sp. TaxID=2910990 RepID=UPI00262EF425|nr:hypothetical protein [Solidesulfovibrio sp.]
MWKSTRRLALGLFAALVLAAPALAADYQIPVVTGEHWTKSSPEERKAFLVGAATVIELDQEVQGATPAVNSTIDAWARGLAPYTFDQMVAALDKWYAEHPDKLRRPVIEVMWYELAQPNIGATNIGQADPKEALKEKRAEAKAQAKAKAKAKAKAQEEAKP